MPQNADLCGYIYLPPDASSTFSKCQSNDALLYVKAISDAGYARPGRCGLALEAVYSSIDGSGPMTLNQSKTPFGSHLNNLAFGFGE